MNYKKLDEFIKYLEERLEKGDGSIIDIPKECIDEDTLCKLMKGTGKLNRVICTDDIRIIGSNYKKRVEILLKYCEDYKNLKSILDINNDLSYSLYQEYLDDMYKLGSDELIIPKCFIDKSQFQILLNVYNFTFLKEDTNTIEVSNFGKDALTKLIQFIDINNRLCNTIKSLDLYDYIANYFPISNNDDIKIYLPTSLIKEEDLIKLAALYIIDVDYQYKTSIMKVDGVYTIFNTNPTFMYHLRSYLNNSLLRSYLNNSLHGLSETRKEFCDRMTGTRNKDDEAFKELNKEYVQLYQKIIDTKTENKLDVKILNYCDEALSDLQEFNKSLNDIRTIKNLNKECEEKEMKSTITSESAENEYDKNSIVNFIEYLKAVIIYKQNLLYIPKKFIDKDTLSNIVNENSCSVIIEENADGITILGINMDLIHKLIEYFVSLDKNQESFKDLNKECEEKEMEFIEKIRENRKYEIREEIKNKIIEASYIADSCIFSSDKLTESDVTTLIKNGFAVKKIHQGYSLISSMSKYSYKVIWNIENDKIADSINNDEKIEDESVNYGKLYGEWLHGANRYGQS